MIPNQVFSIDPGNVYTAYAIVDTSTYKPLKFEKTVNKKVLEEMQIYCRGHPNPVIIIERMASMGARVGATVFETCEFIGYLAAVAEMESANVEYVYRRQEKMNLCGTMKAKDKDIRQALIKRFARTENGKGTKDDKDFYYGVSADCWSACAIATTWIDINKEA